MKKLLLTLLAVVTVLAGCGGGFERQTDWEVESFSATTHRGETLALEDLQGKVWLSAFIFTNCATICPPMTANLTDIQEALEEQGVENYKIVAFSVDPEVDSPEVLTEYLSMYELADESKWELLTGYDQAFISQLAKNSFKALVQNDANSDQVIHGSSFYLVDQEGIVVKSYSGVSDVPVDEIAEDMKALSEE